MIKKLLLIAAAAGTLASAEEAIDFEARRQSVATMREHIAIREARLEAASEDLSEQGEEIDQRIGRIVDSLAGLKDSEGSKTRISGLKQEVADGLMRQISFYQAERRKLVERAKKDGKASIDGIAGDVARIDAMVEKRADQIVKLVSSIPGARDVKKYESDGYYGGSGWGWENSRISEEWRQNRRDKVQSQKARREARKALEGAIEELERRRGSIRSKLSNESLSSAEREIQAYELEHVEGLLAARRRQLVEVTTPSPEPGQVASKSEADEMSSLFEDARRNLSSDFSEAVRLYRKIVDERDRLHQLRENLAAREAWLEANDPDWDGAASHGDHSHEDSHGDQSHD